MYIQQHQQQPKTRRWTTTRRTNITTNFANTNSINIILTNNFCLNIHSNLFYLVGIWNLKKWKKPRNSSNKKMEIREKKTSRQQFLYQKHLFKFSGILDTV